MLKSYARERVKSEDGFIMFQWCVSGLVDLINRHLSLPISINIHVYRSEIVENPSFDDIAFVFLLK